MYRLIGEIKSLNNHVLRKLHSDEILKSQEEISGCRGFILGYLIKRISNGETVYQKDIEKAFSLRRSSATQILNNFEKSGLISRKNEDLDKRLKKIIVTEKGEKTHQAVINRLDEIDAKLTAKLTKEELEIFKRITEKLKEELSSD